MTRGAARSIALAVTLALTTAGASCAGSATPAARPGAHATTPAATGRPAAPRGLWRLSETNGTVAADAVGDAAGTYIGDVRLGTTGPADGDAAAALDGVGATVRIPDADARAAAGALSLEAWVKPARLPSQSATIMRKDGQFLLRLTSTGSVVFRLWRGGAEHELSTPGGTVVARAWNHLAATYDGARMRVFVDGRGHASLPLTGPVDVTASSIYLGASSGAYDWFAGALHGVAVYDAALPPAQVRAAAGAAGARRSAVRLLTPAGGAPQDARPTFGGSAGTYAGHTRHVAIRIYRGRRAAGRPVRRLVAHVRSAGTFSVRVGDALPSGTYTARARQLQGGRYARSSDRRFRVDARADRVLLAAGDIAGCDSSGDELTARLLDRLPGIVAPLGDLAYEYATSADFASCYDPTWGRHRARTRPVPGSHDYAELESGADPYFRYFGRAAGAPSRGYYSYELGAWHVIALNSVCRKVGGCAAGSRQERWLRADLANHPGGCTLAYFHDPRFSSGTMHGGSRALEPFWRALYEAGAEVVLSGHDHGYERFAPQTPTGALDRERGIRQFVVGTGGRSHYGFGKLLANSEAHRGDTYGVLQLTLRAGGYDWRFVAREGKSFADSGSGTCH